MIRGSWTDFGLLVRAWRIAGWANHAWGLLHPDQLAEVWDICPSLPGFVQILPGYVLAKGWEREGPAGWGVLAPELLGSRPGEFGLRVSIGSHSQVRVDCYADQTIVEYRNGERFALACFENGMVVGADGLHAQPRDWARVARILVVTEDLEGVSMQSVIDFLRNIVGEEGTNEFDRYIALSGPNILAGRDIIVVGD